MATPTTIAQLRCKLEDVEDPAQFIQDDFYLAMWLNLKNLDVRKAEAAIRDALAWYKAKDIASLLQKTFPPALINKVPLFLDGVSKEGLPVGYVRLTAIDLHGLLSQFKVADVVQYAIHKSVNDQRRVLETNRLRQAKLGDEALRSAQGFIAIIDAYDLSRRHLPPLKAISVFVQAARETVKMPHSARVAYVIGVRTLFLAIVKPLAPFLSSLGVTLKVYGTDEKTWEPELSKIIDMRTLEDYRARASKFENANYDESS